MISFAPGRFSTTTCWLQVSVSFWPIARTKMSAGPPAVYGTRMRTGFAGYGCATAVTATVHPTTAAASSAILRIRWISYGWFCGWRAARRAESTVRAGSLVRCDAVPLDERRPGLALALQAGGGELRRVEDGDQRLRLELLGELRRSHCLRDLGAYALDDGGRRPRRRDHAEGTVDLNGGETRLGKRGRTGERARAVGDRERDGFAAAEMRQRGSEVGEHEFQLAAEKILVGRTEALVRHVQEARAGLLLEHAHAEIGRAAGAGGAERHGPGIAFPERDEIGQRFRGDRRVNADDHRAEHAARHGNEVALGTVRQVRVQAGIDGDRWVRGEEKGVAVGRRSRDRLRADVAAGAGLVVDDERLFKRVAQRLREEAGVKIGSPAGRRGHDEPHRFCGPGVLRRGLTRDHRKHESHRAD